MNALAFLVFVSELTRRRDAFLPVAYHCGQARGTLDMKLFAYFEATPHGQHGGVASHLTGVSLCRNRTNSPPTTHEAQSICPGLFSCLPRERLKRMLQGSIQTPPAIAAHVPYDFTLWLPRRHDAHI